MNIRLRQPDDQDSVGDIGMKTLALVMVLFIMGSPKVSFALPNDKMCWPNVRYDLERSGKFTVYLREKCQKGQIVRAFVWRPDFDPAYFSSTFCDFDKQIIHAPYPGKENVYTIACVLR